MQDALNEFYRQFPRTESHAFRDESKASLFNLTKIYQQIDYNDSLIMEHHVTRGRLLLVRRYKRFRSNMDSRLKR